MSPKVSTHNGGMLESRCSHPACSNGIVRMPDNPRRSCGASPKRCSRSEKHALTICTTQGTATKRLAYNAARRVSFLSLPSFTNVPLSPTTEQRYDFRIYSRYDHKCGTRLALLYIVHGRKLFFLLFMYRMRLFPLNRLFLHPEFKYKNKDEIDTGRRSVVKHCMVLLFCSNSAG